MATNKKSTNQERGHMHTEYNIICRETYKFIRTSHIAIEWECPNT